MDVNCGASTTGREGDSPGEVSVGEGSGTGVAVDSIAGGEGSSTVTEADPSAEQAATAESIKPSNKNKDRFFIILVSFFSVTPL
jgi:hypothetical protein